MHSKSETVLKYLVDVAGSDNKITEVFHNFSISQNT